MNNPDIAWVGPLAEVSRNYIAENPVLPMDEKTFQESAYVAESLNKPFNTDDLYEKRGDYSLYDEMKTDDQVSVALQLKKDMVLNAGWHISSENEEDEEIIDFVTYALEECVTRPLEEMLEEVLTAYEYGFSISEKIFTRLDDGRIVLKELKTRWPGSWLIHTDEHGNIEKLEQRGVSSDIEVDPSTVIHYVNKPAFQNPYGTSDLRPSYAAWFIKQQIVKYYAIFLEKYASPTPIAKYDLNAPKAAVQDIFDAIKRFQAKTALAIPKDIDIEFLESKGNGEVYIKGINMFNMFIGRSLVIPDLLGFQGGETGGGSFSLGQEQIAVFLNHINRRRTTLERIVNQHIVRPIIISNFGIMEDYPKWVLNPVKEEDKLEFAKVFIEAVKGKLYKPTEDEINHLRSSIKFPEGDVEFYEEPKQVVPGQAPGEEQDVPANDTNPDENPFNPPSGNIDKTKYAKPYGPHVGDFYKRVDFKMAENAMEKTVKDIMNGAKPILKSIFASLADQIESKNIIKNQNAEKIEDLKIKNLGQLKQLLKAALKSIYQTGHSMARAEIFKAEFRVPLDDETFLEVLEQETFQFIGDWEYNIRKKARVELLKAIKDGLPLSTVLDAIDDEGLAEAEVSLERFSRTKSTEMLNHGRQAFFDQAEVVDGYQYSAIMDDRTTEICSGLHNKFFKKGSEPVPPMHFNCRSMLIPVTVFEKWKPTETIRGESTEDFIKNNIGKGFSVK